MMAKEKPNMRSPIDDSIKSHSEKLEKQKKELEASEDYVKIVLTKLNDIHELKLDNNEYMHNRISYSKSKLLELAANIAKLAESNSGILGTGILNPIMLRNNNGRLERIHGDNRIKALAINEKDSAPSIILENVSDELARFMRSSENLNREDLNAYDETLSILEHLQLSCGFKSMNEAKSFINKIKNYSLHRSSLSNKEKETYSKVTEVFEKIGRFDVLTFVDRLKVLNLHDLIKQALVDGLIGYSQSIVINRLKLENDIKKTIKLANSSSMTIKKLKNYVVSLLNKDREIINIVDDPYNKFKKNYSKITSAKINKLSSEEKALVDKTIKDMEKMLEKISNLF